MKYELTKNKKEFGGLTLFQIEAVSSFGNVSKGELGGWVEEEYNLSQHGEAWVYGEAQVYGNARVYGDARVSGNARVSCNAWVFGNAQVSGDAQVYGKAWVSGEARVYGDVLLCAKNNYTKGWYNGGDDSRKITEITDKTGSDYWNVQDVLGDYEILPVEDDEDDEVAKAIKLLKEKGKLKNGKILI